jgi:putative toxin-antitoxin system antitoxin component (TIGR02293 family)
MWMSRAVTEGLPLSALESVVRQVAPDDKDFVYKFISRPTLARRKKAVQEWKDHLVSSDLPKARISGVRQASVRAPARTYLPRSRTPEPLLSPTEGARVARLAEVWAMARRVWGSDAEARAFLFRPHPMLEGGRPIDVVIADEFGRPLVEGILGRLQYGSAA